MLIFSIRVLGCLTNAQLVEVSLTRTDHSACVLSYVRTEGPYRCAVRFDRVHYKRSRCYCDRWDLSCPALHAVLCTPSLPSVFPIDTIDRVATNSFLDM